MNCSEDAELITHPLFYLASIICILSSILAYVFVIFLFKTYALKLFWHLNFRILFFLNIAISFQLSTVVLINFFNYFFKLLTEDNICDVLVRVNDCFIIRFLFLFSFISITLNHTAMIIERFWATRKLANYENSNGMFGTVLAILTITIGTIMIYFVMLPDDGEELMPTCFSFSATKMGNYLYIMYRVQFVVQCFVFLFHRWLTYMNSEKKFRNTQEYLTQRFQRSENLAVLQQTNPLVLTSACFIGSYIIVASLVRILQDYITKNQYILINFYIFIIPHMPFVMMLGALHMLRKANIKKKESVEKNIQIEIKHLRTFTNNFYKWDSIYDNRHGIKHPSSRKWGLVRNVVSVTK